MSNDDTASELEKLRAELAVLKEAQREPASAAAGSLNRPAQIEFSGLVAHFGHATRQS
jgi:hypothetical protein